MVRAHLVLEVLEGRSLPSVVAVDVGETIRPVNSEILGANLLWSDGNLNTPQTREMVKASGLDLFRMPGGAFSDVFHFNATEQTSYGLTTPSMAHFITDVGGTGMVTLNYGTGSPQEAAAYLAYLNAPVGSTTPIGPGSQWSPEANAWVPKDWKDAGYWAALRASSPLPVDDGQNFLRVGRVEPFGIKYFEIGNEVYGYWEVDTHAKPHDEATYVAFAKQFAGLAEQIDPTAEIGLCIAGPGSWFYLAVKDWTDQLLTQCAAQGFIPDFVSDHQYMQDTFFESDETLLLHTSTDPASVSYTGPINWAGRARMFRSMIDQHLGVAGAGIRLMATEYNTSTFLLTNQTTSLVSGLWLADSLGGMLQTEYDGAAFWALRSGWDPFSRYSPAFYGWRHGGDHGMIGSSGGPGPPQSGPYVPYPTYFAMELASKIVHAGDTVVQAVSDDPTLGAYAIKQANGHLGLLVVNKNPDLDLDVQFQITGFTPNGRAAIWQYGKAEDTIQSMTTDGHSSLTSSSQTVSINGASFHFSSPQYSMTVLDLAPMTSRPPGWTSGDVGGPAREGSSWSDGAAWTVNGGGSDIGGASDQFHFDSRALDGDGSVSARVDRITSTTPSAKAGVMMRDGTAANARFASMVLTPGNGLAFQWRTNTGGPSGMVQIPNVEGPVWVKLTRARDRFTGYYSLDGTHWTKVGSTRTIAMRSTARAGLAVSAHDAALATATFTNVAVQSGFTKALSRAGWVASASSTEFWGSPARAVDNRLGTRWSSGTSQAAGQWFQLDLGSAQTFQRLVLDSIGSPFDYPRGFAVYLSDNGVDWTSQSAVATGTGGGAVTTITLDAAVTKRYVRIVLTQGGSFWWWSIRDLGVFV